MYLIEHDKLLLYIYISIPISLFGLYKVHTKQNQLCIVSTVINTKQITIFVLLEINIYTLNGQNYPTPRQAESNQGNL